MKITVNNLFGFLSLYGICFFLGYYFLRNLLWSIVWCDKKGKYNSLKKLRQNKKLLELIKMDYLSVYVCQYKKDFDFWMRIKKVYEILEIVLLIAYLIFAFLYLQGLRFDFILKAIIVQAFVACCFFMLQTDINRDTKYDRIRKYNRKKNRNRK